MTTAPVDDRLKTIHDAGYQLLGTARDMPGDVEALAWALHDQQRGCACGTGREPSEDTWARASELVQAGWRRDLSRAALELANLLAEVGIALDSDLNHDGCPAERERWTPVADLAARISRELTK